MLHLLLVALPLVVALPAAFDKQEANALHCEPQSPLQLEVRSPPKSRPLRPQPPREINTIAQPQHTPLRTHTTRQAHTSASRHGSATSPPTLTRVALTCIYTARTTHSRHRLPLAARFHSNARAPADTFLVPARSPRKTRPSRRPPRSARPLVRPTSFMRTTTPRSPPAKALRTMSLLRCAQSLHACGQKAASSLQVLFAKGTRVATAP